MKKLAEMLQILTKIDCRNDQFSLSLNEQFVKMEGEKNQTCSVINIIQSTTGTILGTAITEHKSTLKYTLVHYNEQEQWWTTAESKLESSTKK